MSDTQDVEIELFCIDLPAAHLAENPLLRLGVQQKRETVDDVSVAAAVAAEGHIVFRFPLRVGGKASDGAPRLLGPHAQGTPANRFVYLCWGTREHGEWIPQRRAKVPLSGITWEQIDAARITNQSLRATIPCTNATGEPAAASLKPDTFSWGVVDGA